MPAVNPQRPGMDVLSPRSTNVPMKSGVSGKKAKAETKTKAEEKPQNPDRIDDKWRPPSLVSEPGPAPETYITGKKLGKGGFAVCFEGTTKNTSQVFALKVVKAHVELKKMMEKFRTELQIHAKMQHPNIVEFHRAFTSNNYTYVVLELCGNGSLTDMVKNRSCLSLPEVRRFMIQICGGVKYMHKRSVIHRDLKMGNIFLDARMNIKIGDFGLAAVMADEQDRRTTLCGTPNYIAPEILSKSGSRGHDNKVDTWAVGVICYAMLMGTPPFQSKTQQEIYTKLKTLEYEWKIDSKNYIPQQAKDFVSSCLTLSSAERPEMDELVEHEFFKMGAIADELDDSCLKVKPMWLENMDPRGDKVRLGYGIDHNQLCKECGVGRTAEGHSRPAVGEKANISTLVEIEAENRQGCAPTIPLPEGVLYKQYTATVHKHTLVASRPRSRKPPADTLNLPSVVKLTADINSGVEAAAATGLVSQSKAAPINRTTKSFAAQQRQQALPSRVLPRQVEVPAQTERSTKLTVDEELSVPSRGYLRERPLRALSIRSTRSYANRDAVAEAQQTISKSVTVPDGLDAEPGVQLTSGTAEVSRSRRQVTINRSASHAQIHTIKQPCTLYLDDKINTRQTSCSSSDAPPGLLHTTTANDRRTGVKVYVGEKPTKTVRKKLPTPPSPSPSSSPSHSKPRVIAPSDSYSILKNTSPSETISSLQGLYERLSIARSNAKSSISTGPALHCNRARVSSPHPRVDKWVDYSTRHGIAYILTDDTVGMVLKSSEDNSTPSACVVVRNAKAHTLRRARGLEGQIVPQDANANDVEFYEHCKVGRDEGMRKLAVPARRFKLDLGKYPDAGVAAGMMLEGLKGCEAERLRLVGLLDKFGKYMNKQTDGGDVEEGGDNSGAIKFINFYQRLGNVGVWRFADGGFQFNFPDHTKLVLYSISNKNRNKNDLKNESSDMSRQGDEWMVDLVHLDPRDARDLARRGGALTLESFERRGLVTLSLGEIFDDEPRRGGEDGAAAAAAAEIVQSNQVREKMAWIRGVIGCWIREGGLGRMGEERVGWSGIQEGAATSRSRLHWVCVGRAGGDGDGDVKKEATAEK